MKPSKGQLRRGAGDVDYEIDMLMQMAKRLNRTNSGGPIAQAAYLESWAVHLRCLIEFFHPTRNDTLRAEHYVSDPAAWAKACPELNRREERRRKALHELLAHIEITRDARKSNWSSADHRIATRRIAVFLGHLPKRRLSWFARARSWFP